MSKFGKGGWRKKAKKVLAGVLAGAMVLTSGVIVPQNAKTAEAADQTLLDEFGKDNGDGTYELGFGYYHSVPVEAGDFKVSYSFRNKSAVGTNWDNYVVKVDNWTLRADRFSFGEGIVQDESLYNGGPDWGIYADVMKDAEVSVDVVREGSTITITNSVVGASGGEFSWSASLDNCTTGATTVELGGENCYVAIYEATYTKLTRKVLDEFGKDNGDGTYELGFGYYHSKSVAAGDFELTYVFQNKSAVGTNWDNYVVKVDNWTLRADRFSFGEGIVQDESLYNGGPDWGIYADVMKNAEVTVTVRRAGSTVTIINSVVGANGGEFSWSASLGNCTTGATTIELGGENCYIAIYEETLTQLVKHTLTINYLYENKTEAAKSVTQEITEKAEYSVVSPEIKGFLADQPVVSGTMGTEDVVVNVIYKAVDEHTATVEYVYEDGSVAAESQKAVVDEGKTYSIKSPTITGYHPDKNTVTRTMGAKDETITVTYKKVIQTMSTWDATEGKYVGGWWIYKDGYKIYKMGNFDVTYSFHTQTNVWGDYASYGIGITTDISADYEAAGDWFMTSAAGELSRFSGSTVDYADNDYAKDGKDAFIETLQDAEVTVNVVRNGTTIIIKTDITGANDRKYSGTAVANNCPGGEMNVFLTADWCELNVYSATESDVQPKEGNFVVVHYVYEDGSEAAPDAKLGWIEKGKTYSVKSPEIEGYTPDQPTVAGVMGSERLDVTVTYKKGASDYIATVGSIDANGNYSLGYGDLGSYYGVQVPAGDFDISFSFRNLSDGAINWNNYLIAIISEERGEMYMRGDGFFDSAFDMAAERVGIDYGNINWDTFPDIIKSSSVSVSVSRKGDTISFGHSVAGDNGGSISWSATRTGCPTEALTVYLGGNTCYLGITEVVVNGESQAPSTPPSTEPSEPPVEPTETPAAPTETPSEPTTAPTKAPTVSKGDKVTASNATYQVTSTKDKSVTYTSTKNSKKASVTVPKTVKVTSGGKTVTYKVTTVAKGAFKNNDSVKKITIGENITKIEANAFKGCKNLTTIVIKSTKLKTVANNALKGTSKNLVIKVPAKKLKAYTKLFSGKGNSNVTVKKA